MILKDAVGLILLLSGCILITAGIAGDNIGRFKSWFGAVLGGMSLLLAFWLDG